MWQRMDISSPTHFFLFLLVFLPEDVWVLVVDLNFGIGESWVDLMFMIVKISAFKWAYFSLIHCISYFCFLISCQVTVENQSYHKSCFKCSHGGCPITPSNYAALEGILYCKHHFSQLFKEKGSYNHLIKCASIKRTAAAAASVPELWPHLSLLWVTLSTQTVYGTIMSVVLLSLSFIWWRIANLVLRYVSFFFICLRASYKRRSQWTPWSCVPILVICILYDICSCVCANVTMIFWYMKGFANLLASCN